MEDEIISNYFNKQFYFKEIDNNQLEDQNEIKNIHVKYNIMVKREEQIQYGSMQNKGPFLALVISSKGQGEYKFLSFYQIKISDFYEQKKLKNKIEFDKIYFQNKTKIISAIQWSPNDLYLATVGGQILTIYKWLKVQEIDKNEEHQFQYRLDQINEFKDHDLEITSMAWKANSEFIISGAQSYNIIIRHIFNSDFPKKILNINVKILAISWDPLDKYIIALTGNNEFAIWNVQTLELIKKQSLNFSFGTAKQFVRENRKIDWSSNYNHILIPSIDDQIIPIVMSINRQDFNIKCNFVGPYTSINCIKFSPCLYRIQGQVVQIFAMGDNDGNVSIWALPENDQEISKEFEKPLYLFKSHVNLQELIEELCWNGEGNLLIAIARKRYIQVFLFDEGIFGQKLNYQNHKRYLEDLYGKFYASKFFLDNVDNQQEGNQFSIIQQKPNQQQILNENKQEQNKSIILNPNIRKINSKVINQLSTNKNEQLIYNNQDQLQQITKDNEFQSKENKIIQNQKQQMQRIQLNQIQELPKKYSVRLQNGNYLELIVTQYNERVITKINCYQFIQHENQQQNLLLWNDFVNGQVKLVEVCSKIIAYYTNKNELIFSCYSGRRIFATKIISNISYLKLFEPGIILIIIQNGELLLLDLQKSKYLLKTSITCLLEQQDNMDQMVEIRNAWLNEILDLYIIIGNQKIYSYNKILNLWQQSNIFELEMGCQQNNFDLQKIISYIKYSQHTTDNQDIENFFNSLDKQNSNSEYNEIQTIKNLQILSQLEESMMLEMQKNQPYNFIQLSKQYVQQLCYCNQINKLRQFLLDIFSIDSKEKSFLLKNQINFQQYYQELSKLLQNQCVLNEELKIIQYSLNYQ